MEIIDVTLTRFTWMAFHQPTMGRIFACREGPRRLDCWPSKPAWASRAMLSTYGVVVRSLPKLAVTSLPRSI
jgi:hypothetical protein